MADFRINLVKDTVLPFRKRRLVFWGMLVYVVLCGAILAWIARAGTRSLIETSSRRELVAAEEREFRASAGTDADIVSYAATVEREMRECHTKLQSVNAILAKRVGLARILGGLVAPLPHEVNIIGFEMDDSEETIKFSVAARGTGKDAFSAGQYIALWSRDEGLMSMIGGIRSTISERKTTEGAPLMIFRFECALAGGEG